MNWFIFSAGFIGIIVVGIIALIIPENSDKKRKVALQPVTSIVVSAIFMALNTCILYVTFAINLVCPSEYAFIGVIVGALWIPFSWLIIGKLIRYIDTKNIMKQDTMRIIFIASIVLAMIMSVILTFKNKEYIYMQLVGSGVALFVGTFFPIDDYYTDGKMKPVCTRIKEVFKTDDVSIYDIVAVILVSVVLVLFTLFDEFRQACEMALSSFALGLGAGVIVIFAIVYIMIKRKAKQKKKGNS